MSPFFNETAHVSSSDAVKFFSSARVISCCIPLDFVGHVNVSLQITSDVGVALVSTGCPNGHPVTFLQLSDSSSKYCCLPRKSEYAARLFLCHGKTMSAPVSSYTHRYSGYLTDLMDQSWAYKNTNRVPGRTDADKKTMEILKSQRRNSRTHKSATNESESVVPFLGVPTTLGH